MTALVKDEGEPLSLYAAKMRKGRELFSCGLLLFVAIDVYFLVDGIGLVSEVVTVEFCVWSS